MCRISLVVDVSPQDREVWGSKQGGVTIRIAVNPWTRLSTHVSTCGGAELRQILGCGENLNIISLRG